MGNWDGVTARQEWARRGPCSTAVPEVGRKAAVLPTGTAMPKPSLLMTWPHVDCADRQLKMLSAVQDLWGTLNCGALKKQWARMAKSYKQRELQRFLRTVALREFPSLPESHYKHA